MAYGDKVINVTAEQLEYAVKNFDNKADKTYVNGELNKKADKTYVDKKTDIPFDIYIRYDGENHIVTVSYTTIGSNGFYVAHTETVELDKSFDSTKHTYYLVKDAANIDSDWSLSNEVPAGYKYYQAFYVNKLGDDYETVPHTSVAFYKSVVSKKADKTYVNSELKNKADKTYVNSELKNKADKTYVNSKLEKKADKIYVNSELEKKADITYVDQKTNMPFGIAVAYSSANQTVNVYFKLKTESGLMNCVDTVVLPDVVPLDGVTSAGSVLAYFYLKNTGETSNTNKSGWQVIKGQHLTDAIFLFQVKQSAINKGTYTVVADSAACLYWSSIVQAESKINDLEKKTSYSAGIFGLYNENNELINTWDELINDSKITVDSNVITAAEKTISGKLVIHNSVTSIGDNAFRYCKSLTSVTIPDSVTSIGDWAFSDCTSLTNVTIPGSIEIRNLETISQHVFDGCTSLTDVIIENGVNYIYPGAFGFCTSLKNITIPKSIVGIAINAFDGCSALEDVYYKGTKSDFDKIEIAMGNNNFKNATIHYELTDDVYKLINKKANQTDIDNTIRAIQAAMDEKADISYVNNLMSSAIKRTIVGALPTENIDESTIYMVPAEPSEENNIYVEYMYLSGAWELIGSTAIDLSGYAKREEVEAELINKRNFFTVDDTDDNKTGLGFGSYSGTDVLYVKRDGETITTDEYGNLKVNTDNIASKAYVDSAKAENKSAIETNAEAIASNKSAIETNTANIEKLETDKESLFDLLIKNNIQGRPIMLQDHSTLPLQNMRFYGKSVQDGTPTVDEPVSISSTALKTVNVYGGNVIDISKLPSASTSNIQVEVNGDEITFTAKTSGTYRQVGYEIRDINLFKDKIYIGYNVVNNPKKLNQSLIFRCYDKSNNQLPNKTLWIGTNTITVPKETAYIQIVFCMNMTETAAVGDTVTISDFRISNSYIAYEQYKSPTTVTLSNSVALRGLPVTSGGNITIDNQQYVSDYIDVQSGKLIRNVGIIESYNGEEITTDYLSTTGELSTGATVLYALQNSIEEDLPEEDISKLQAIQPYNPNSIITSNAEMVIDYVADTKKYIDNQYKKLATAITALGGAI